MRAWLCLTAMTVAALCASRFSGAETPAAAAPELRVILFTPADVELPPWALDRVLEAVDYSEAFYAKWMAHWGYDCPNPLRVRRDEQGRPVFVRAKGEQTRDSGAYDKVGFARREVVPNMAENLGIAVEGQVWWMFSHPGVKSGYRGGGNARSGGVSVANCRETSGPMTLDLDMAAGNAEQFFLKAAIHEMGHALGLPHIGPILGDGLGNSLMGPINKVYKSRYDGDSRVYLTRASAAMLWKHPLFAGDGKDLDVDPTVEIEDFEATYDAENDRFEVSGKLKSDYPAHSVVIANSIAGARTQYWQKTFAARLDPDGRFRVFITELDKKDGALKIAFCFNNGAVKGGQKGLGLGKGFLKNYICKDSTYVFDEE
jgi:hypothetical protein